MSLIQEALRKQQQEAKKAAPGVEAPPVQQPAGQEPPVSRASAKLAVAHSEPPPAPPPLPEQAAESLASPIKSTLASKRGVIILVGVTAVVLILAGGGYWYLKGSGSPSEPPQSPAAQPAAGAPTTPAQPPGSTQPQPASTPDESAPPSNQAQTPANGVVETPTETPAESDTGEEAITPDEAMTPPPEPVVVWPVLSVTGIIDGKTKGAASINGKIVDVGQSIDGVKIVAIANQTVELEYKGQKRTVRVGGSTQ